MNLIEHMLFDCLLPNELTGPCVHDAHTDQLGRVLAVVPSPCESARIDYPGRCHRGTCSSLTVKKIGLLIYKNA